ncbi:glycosyltransferase family 4 protein [Notoacmeibacter marinus]|uniref:glycosyltransferase family 4 protein n=1 Tax=Notoacmeibacter marinus TaxID=1876515 RepID=UPI000DF1EB52|nr:glycosyltransferase family 4 protein [Notoacmeibacter marinus]
MIRAVTHLVDDASFGGVNRMLDYMASSPSLGCHHQHRIERVSRGQLSLSGLTTDIIVSHLSISWANLPLLTALRAIYPNHPIIHVEHSYCERFVAAKVSNRMRFETLLRISYSLFDQIVAVSEAQGAWMRRRGYCAGQHLEVLSPCVDLSSFFALPDRPTRQSVTLGAIGRFDEQKGFDILIDAFVGSQREDLRLDLFGDGPERQRLMDKAADHPRIAFHGYLADTSKAVAQCDIIAMPSRWEPYGLVALEAMAAGRPVLCSRADGLNDHIRNKATDIGENSVESWTAFLDAMNIVELAESGRSLRRTAKLSEAKFLLGWNELLWNAVGADADRALAA